MVSKIKRIFSFFVFCLVLPVLMIGCGGSSKDSRVEENDNGILKIYMYNKQTSEKDLKKTVEEIVKEKSKDSNSIKGILVSFYDTDGEQYFGDTVPYAVGGWCTETGIYDSVNQISNKNNKVYIQINSKGEGTPLTKEQKKDYANLLKQFKTNERTRLYDSFIKKVIEDKKTDEMADENSAIYKQMNTIKNATTKYEKDGLNNILKGQL